MALAIDTIASFRVGSNTALWNSTQRWCNFSVLRVWRGQIMSDVFDEEAFALLYVKSSILTSSLGVLTVSFSFSMLSKIVL